MPRGNGTGPMGRGPLTGRGVGYCAGTGRPGYESQGSGRISGQGRGFFTRGRGQGGFRGRRCFSPYVGQGPVFDAEGDKQGLENRAEALRRELEAVERLLARRS
jgi:hypothetical protein